MKRCVIAILLVMCILTVLFSAGCGKKKNNEEEPKLNYSDDYQAAAQVDYETLSVQIRTSSSAYFTGSIISVTAVIENKSQDYYCIAPMDNGFDISVTVDGYKLVPSGAVSPSDAVLILEPNGSVSMTREYKSKAYVSGEERPLWECEPVAEVKVKMSEPAVSRQAAMDAKLSDSKSAKTAFAVYGTGEKP